MSWKQFCENSPNPKQERDAVILMIAAIVIGGPLVAYLIGLVMT